MYKNKHKSRTNMGKQSTVIVKDVSDNNSSIQFWIIIIHQYFIFFK